MPHRRSIKQGSFDGHFDELVTQFPHEPAVKFGSHKHKLPPKRKAKGPACVNRFLLDERAR